MANDASHDTHTANPVASRAQGASGAQHLAYLDALRGWAATAVIFTHVVQAVGPTAPEVLQAIGHRCSAGVQLFFVLSAVTLLMSFDARSRQDTRPVPAFLARRAFRIGPLFWSAAIFYLLWWGGIPSYFAPDGVHPWQVITTLLFVHGWTMESINAVVPGGWSIAVEMNFYLLLPLLRGWITTLTRALVAFVGSVVFAQVAAAVARRLFAESYASDGALFDSFLLFWLPRQLPVFFLGFATFFLLQRKGSWREQSWVKWLPELSLLLLVVLSTLRVPQQFTVMSCAFIPLVVGLSVRPLALFVNPVTRYLGKISFSSYLTHFVVVEWLEHAGMGQWVAQGGVWLGLRLACFYALAVGLAAVLATVTYRAIEVPGQNLGKRWLRWVGWEGSRPKVTEPRELASTR